jgi:hypothetical protein
VTSTIRIRLNIIHYACFLLTIKNALLQQVTEEKEDEEPNNNESNGISGSSGSEGADIDSSLSSDGSESKMIDQPNGSSPEDFVNLPDEGSAPGVSCLTLCWQKLRHCWKWFWREVKDFMIYVWRRRHHLTCRIITSCVARLLKELIKP